MNILSKYFGGHLALGNITIYGFNAMHCAVNIRTKRWGIICFRLPVPTFGRFQPLYFYISPNGTPWAATFLIGGGNEMKRDRLLAPIRRSRLGLNYDAWNDEENRKELTRINNLI